MPGIDYSSSQYVTIHGRAYHLRDVHYFFSSEYRDEQHAFESEPDSYQLFIEGPMGGGVIGRAFTADDARKALGFVKRAA